MRARLVNESLDRFALLDNNFLAENVLNEKLDINVIANRAKKLGVLASMFVMFVGGKAPEIKNQLPEPKQLENSPLLINMAGEDHLSRDDVFDGFMQLLNQFKGEEVNNEEIFNITPEFVEAINKVKPGRLDSTKIDRYEQHNGDILKAIEKLNARGEEVDADFIKAIMIIETGMKPVKNKWGFEGFPQTKQRNIDGINKRFGTDFTMDDMYDAERAAEFIHYFIKAIEKSKYVKTTEDMLIAYNQGIGTLGKIKRGEKEMPSQAKDYIKMFNVMQKHFVS